MQEHYYGFVERPFNLTPDPKYLYRSASHGEAFDLLQHAIRRRQGFVVVTGDIGTGKTTLCRALLEQVDRNTFTALVLNPFITEEDLLRLILQDFGVVSREDIKRGRLAGVTRQELIDSLNEFLLSLIPLRAGALVIIDEAQNLPRQVLEQIRILSNLETHKQKLLQIVLVGQLELKQMLRSPDLRQLDQRVAVLCELKPLTREETAAYVAHRLTIAGAGKAVSFPPSALALVHKYTGGIPRVINLLCDRALSGGSLEQTNVITPAIVTEAATARELVRPRRSILGRWPRRRALAFAAAAAMMAVAIAGVAYGAIALQARPSSGSAPAEAPPVPRLASAAAPPATMPPQRGADAQPSVKQTSPATTVDDEPVASQSAPTSGAAPDRPDVATSRAMYSLLVGSFLRETEAVRASAHLEALGFQVRTTRVASSRGLWHQVLAGPYDDLAKARQDEARVRQMSGYHDARVVTQ